MYIPYNSETIYLIPVITQVLISQLLTSNLQVLFQGIQQDIQRDIPFFPEKNITYFNPKLHAMMYINFRSTMAGETTNWSRSSSIQHTKFFFQAFGLYLLLRQHL